MQLHGDDLPYTFGPAPTWGYELECPCGVKAWAFDWHGAAWNWANHVRNEHASDEFTPSPTAYKLCRFKETA